MLVDNKVCHNLYVGNGVTREFPYEFPVLDAEHLLVMTKAAGEEAVTLKVWVDYDILDVTNPDGGTIILYKVPPVNTEIYLGLNVPLSQLTKYRELDNFPAESHENALSKLTLITQEISCKLDRAITLPVWGVPDWPDWPGEPGKPMTPDEFIAYFIRLWREALDAAEKACDCAEKACECADIACGCAGVLVAQPYVILPRDGEQNASVLPLMTFTSFVTIGQSDLPAGTRCQIAEVDDPFFNNPVWEYDGAYTTSIQMVGNPTVMPPQIFTPVPDSTMQSVTPDISLSAFLVRDGTDEPKSTEIQITEATDTAWNNPVWGYSGAYTTTAKVT